MGNVLYIPKPPVFDYNEVLPKKDEYLKKTRKILEDTRELVDGQKPLPDTFSGHTDPVSTLSGALEKIQKLKKNKQEYITAQETQESIWDQRKADKRTNVFMFAADLLALTFGVPCLWVSYEVGAFIIAFGLAFGIPMFLKRRKERKNSDEKYENATDHAVRLEKHMFQLEEEIGVVCSEYGVSEEDAPKMLKTLLESAKNFLAGSKKIKENLKLLTGKEVEAADFTTELEALEKLVS